MSNIHNAGPNSENSDLSVEEVENKNENANIAGRESSTPSSPSPMGNTDPIIVNK